MFTAQASLTGFSVSNVSRSKLNFRGFAAQREVAVAVPVKPLEEKRSVPWVDQELGKRPTVTDLVVVNAPANLIRRGGGYVLPYNINWPADATTPRIYWPVISRGVHTNVVFFGYSPLLQQFCDELRERTLPEYCVMVVGSDEDAKTACEALRKLRFFPNAGSLVFKVTKPGKWPRATCPKSQQVEWAAYVNWAADMTNQFDRPFRDRSRGCLPSGWGQDITYWRGYTSQPVLVHPFI
eukprot:jgi/Botrbrau1/21240/Bobra.39_2s0038.2